ncbi:MAG: hypothetical protein DCC49_01825 [Acidobacteria bacterium]|nr:MAG: hypothetical protein DCC49_01825 [Acidobacteriota bacterium]
MARILDEDGRTVAFISGPLDSYSVPTVRTLLRRIDRDRDLVIDLSECTYVDTAGLWVLRERARDAEQSGGSMVVRCVSPRVRKVIAATGFDRLVVIEDQPAADAYRASATSEERTLYKASEGKSS